MGYASPWSQLTNQATAEQLKQIVEACAVALEHLTLAELRDRQALLLRAQQTAQVQVQKANVNVPPEVFGQLVQQIVARLGGLGFLNDLLPPQRTDLSEIAVTPQGDVWVLAKGAEFFTKLAVLQSREECWRAVEALLAPIGRGLTEATPTVDAKLPREAGFGGARIKVLHPVVAPGNGYPSINIRLFEPRPVSLGQLRSWQVAPESVIQKLVAAVGRGARVLVIGGTASGKTTLLAALANGIPKEARVVKIEDPEEIWLDHPHVVTIEARPSVPGASVLPYTIKDGVDDAMRMSPKWLIVGEVRRGDAAMALFRAQMSDHPGLSTFHAEGPEEAVFRLGVIMYADLQVQLAAAKSIFAQAVDLIVQQGWRDGRRVIIGVWQVIRELREGEVEFTTLYQHGQAAMQEFTRR